MAKKNIDINLELMAMIDSQVRLFEGDYSPEILLHMDIPSKKALVTARLLNLSRSRARLEEAGVVDQFTKNDVSLQMMRGGGKGGLLG
jgi:hypothetical protein